MDTFAADRHLGFSGDSRSFTVAAETLQSLDIPHIALLTHNPHKAEALRRAGIDAVDRIGFGVPLNQHCVETKRHQAGHLP